MNIGPSLKPNAFHMPNRGKMRLCKCFLLSGFFIFGIVLSTLRTYDYLKNIPSNVEEGAYSDFIHMQCNQGTRKEKLELISKHLKPTNTLFFWQPKEDYEKITTECSVTYINYFLYPLKTKYGYTEDISGSDYIIVDEVNQFDFMNYLNNREINTRCKLTDNRNSLILFKVTDTDNE